MFAETAKLVADLSLKGNFNAQLKGANKALGSFDSKLTDTQGRAYKAGQQIGTGIKSGLKIAAVAVGLLATQVMAGLGQLVTLEKATAATNAVIKSTKGVANISAAAIRGLAEKYENLNATIDDKVIQSGENMLLTFTNIRKDAFEPALKAALNLNTAMGGGEGGLQGTIIKVGKALNDPTKGLTALGRVGVKFDAGQIKRIKALQKEGKLYEAQKIILKELGVEFGGQFAAEGNTAAGAIAGIGDAVEDLQKNLATALFPTVQKVLPKIRAFLTDPGTLQAFSDAGDAIAGLFTDENIASGVETLKGFFNAAKAAAPALIEAAKVTGRIVGTAVDIFKSLPPEIQSLAVAGLAINKLTGGLVTNLAGGLIGAVLKNFATANVNIQAANVNVVGGAGGAPGLPGGAGPGGAVAGAAGAAGGISLAAVGALVAVPLGIAAVGLAIRDQSGKAEATGRALTATARGIPDKVNKGLLDAARITGSATDDVRDRVESAKVAQISALAQTKAGIASAVSVSGNLVASVIRSSRPIVNVNTNVSVTAGNVQKSVTNSLRYGSPNGSHGSRNKDRDDGP